MDNKPLTFKEIAEKVIRDEKRPLTANEIWDIAEKKGYSESKNRGKTPWNTISAHIYVDMRDNKKSPFIKSGTMPRKFFLKDLINNEEDKRKINAIIENQEKKTEVNFLKYKEIDLHPFLTYYADVFMGIYTKTVNHQKSKKNVYSQWLHPDIVGVRFPFDDLENNETIEFAKEIASIPIKLYSFEIKIKLDFSNIRESFFQTVSNSSWANESYLVASEINDSNDFSLELERLSYSFGIGIIKLNIHDPDSSEVLYPAKYRNELDWATISKLAEINEDFRDFLKSAKDSIKINQAMNDYYDKVFESDELIKKINQIE